jgi:hypothetical protein
VDFDHERCRTCGAEVRLEPRASDDVPDAGGPVGPTDGVVGTADPTVDRRVCTDAGCPSNSGDGDAPV